VDESEGGMYLSVGGKVARDKRGNPIWFNFSVFESLGKNDPVVKDPYSEALVSSAFGG
jgi:hypothetical protein